MACRWGGQRRNIPACAGKTLIGARMVRRKWGTSPRARGKLLPAIASTESLRNIPACAGKTLHHAGSAGNISEHPRVRGENLANSPWEKAIIGTSPRARGKLKDFAGNVGTWRNIPACAGKTLGNQHASHAAKEHPRVRGENFWLSVLMVAMAGTSPRARGKRLDVHQEVNGGRNIPACAGKTFGYTLLVVLIEEHPRVRGENERLRGVTITEWGTSPRARGKP